MIAPLNVLRWGDPAADKTVVALHGITANGGAFAAPARLLAERGWRVLAPDMRGHGESPRADGDFSTAALIADLVAAVPRDPDVLIGHSFGGYLAQVGVLEGVFRPRALVLEDPVSHFADKETPAAMLAWDEAHLPRSIEGLLAFNPKWSRLDAAWKLLSIEQIDFRDATSAFSGNAPWDLRPRAAEIAARQPTVWVLPQISRFVPAEAQRNLKQDVGERAVVVIPDVGHSIHRDAAARVRRYRDAAQRRTIAVTNEGEPMSLKRISRHCEQSEAIQTKPQLETLSLDRFALLAMTENGDAPSTQTNPPSAGAGRARWL